VNVYGIKRKNKMIYKTTNTIIETTYPLYAMLFISFLVLIYNLFLYFRLTYLYNKKQEWADLIYAFCILNIFFNPKEDYSLIETNNKFNFSKVLEGHSINLNKLIDDNYYSIVNSFFKKYQITKKDIKDIIIIGKNYTGEDLYNSLKEFIRTRKEEYYDTIF